MEKQDFFRNRVLELYPYFEQTIGILESEFMDGLRLPRSGWVQKRISNEGLESILEHTYKLVLATHYYISNNPEFDEVERFLALSTALIHDSPEAKSTHGDVNPYQGITEEQKYLAELTGLNEIELEFEGKFHFQAGLWRNYESKKLLTPDNKNYSSWVKAVNRLDKACPMVQSMFYQHEVDCSDFQNRNGVYVREDPRIRRALGIVLSMDLGRDDYYNEYFSALADTSSP